MKDKIEFRDNQVKPPPLIVFTICELIATVIISNIGLRMSKVSTYFVVSIAILTIMAYILYIGWIKLGKEHR